MATIKNIRFKIERQPDPGPFNPGSTDGLLEFDVEFSGDELRLNLAYTVAAFLVEVDGKTDSYILLQNGSTLGLVRPVGDDDLIGWFKFENNADQRIRPDGDASKSIEMRLVMRGGTGASASKAVERAGKENFDGQSQDEEYKPIIMVTPDTAPAMAFGPMVKENLVGGVKGPTPVKP